MAVQRSAMLQTKEDTMTTIEAATPVHKNIQPRDFAMRLELLSERAYGVEAAVRTILDDDAGKLNQGIVRLVAELAEDLERLSEVFGAELAASRPAPYKPGSFLDALDRHEDALRALDEHRGPGDIDEALVDAEAEASMALATLNCLPGAVPTKLRRLLMNHKRAHGPMWRDAGAPEIMAALDLHFGAGWDGKTNAWASRAHIGGILEEGAEPQALDEAAAAELLEDPAIAAELDKIGAK